MSGTVPAPVATATVRAVSTAARTRFTASTRRRRSSRSTYAPLISEKSSHGSCWAKAAPAISAGSSVSEATSSGPAARTMPSPTFETALAAHSGPKPRPSRGASVLRHGSIAATVTGSPQGQPGPPRASEMPAHRRRDRADVLAGDHRIRPVRHRGQPLDAQRPDRAVLRSRHVQRGALAAVRTGEVGHVLHAAEQRDPGCGGAPRPPGRCPGGESRRRHHQQHRDVLGLGEQALLDLPGAGRQVDHEHVQLAPHRLVQQPAEHEVRERAGHGQPLVAAEQEAHRGDPEAGDVDPASSAAFGAPPAAVSVTDVALTSRRMPSIRGTSGPCRSASSNPTRRPWRTSSRASPTATLVLPTPPFPLATATTGGGMTRA